MEQVADPLLPAAGGFTLRPGESRMVFVMLHGRQSGKWKGTLRVESEAELRSLSIDVQVVNVELAENLSLNAVTWGYLESPLIKDRQQAAARDLLAHHTNVVVVPPAYLPVPD